MMVLSHFLSGKECASSTLLRKYKNHQPLEGGCQFNNFLFSDAWRKDPQSPTKFVIKKSNLSTRKLRQLLHEQPASFNLYRIYYFFITNQNQVIKHIYDNAYMIRYYSYNFSYFRLNSTIFKI